jgi:hypothetical protein
MVTDDAKCTLEIKSRIAMAKAAFNKKTTLFHNQIGLKCMEETSEVLHWDRMVLKLRLFGK